MRCDSGRRLFPLPATAAVRSWRTFMFGITGFREMGLCCTALTAAEYDPGGRKFRAPVNLTETVNKEVASGTTSEAGISGRRFFRKAVVRGGIEPPTHGFSIHCSTN